MNTSPVNSFRCAAFFVCLAVSLLFFSGCSGGSSSSPVDSAVPAETTGATFPPGQIILGGRITPEVERVFREYQAEIVGAIPQLNAYKVKLPETVSMQKCMAALSGVNGVDYATPNYTVERIKDFESPSSPRFSSRVKEMANDAYSEDLWGLEAIHAPEAWKISTGSPDVVVAVIDTGVQADHPDLAGKVLKGFDVFESTADTDDQDGHGTHVAGTAAGIGNNTSGVAGIAWGCPILPIRIFRSDTAKYQANSFEIARGFVWLTDWARNNRNKRIVANMSFGGGDESPVVHSALDLAISEGIVFCAAMGNSSDRTRENPATHNGVIAVGAMDEYYKQANFSTSGNWISVTAPGVNILSTCVKNTYARYNGTSMATPHVTGVIALLLSKNPKLTPREVKAIIQKTADSSRWGGIFDEKYGYGLVNAFAALNDTNPIEQLHRLDVTVTSASGSVPLYRARVALYKEGVYQKEALVNAEGQTVFHDVPAGSYTAFVSYSFNGDFIPTKLVNYDYGYAWLFDEKGINIVDNPTASYNTLNFSVQEALLKSLSIRSVVIGGENVDLTGSTTFSIIDQNDKPVFENIRYSIASFPAIRIAPGSYTIKTVSADPLIEFEKKTMVSLTNLETRSVACPEVDLASLSLDLVFEDKAGKPLDEGTLDKKFTIYRSGTQILEREVLVADKGKAGFDWRKIYLSPGKYKIVVSANEPFTSGLNYRRLGSGFREIELANQAGEITQIKLIMR